MRDLNANGTIDSGRELFGVDTQITVTVAGGAQELRNAHTGFHALAALDTGANGPGSVGAGDGVFDAKDAAFPQLRLWRDLNGDGISQAGELQTLAATGVVSISLAAVEDNRNLGDGNSLTATSTVTYADGHTTAAAGVNLTAGNLNLAENGFYRTFTDTIPLTQAAKALPDLGGSGSVRDLREAMSLGTTQSTALTGLVQQFAAATTREAQVAVVDQILLAWAKTSPSFVADGTNAVALRAINQQSTNDGTVLTTFRVTGSGHVPIPVTGAQPTAPSNGDLYVKLQLPESFYTRVEQGGQSRYEPTPAYHDFIRRVSVLEVFNGGRVVDYTTTVATPTLTGGASNPSFLGQYAISDWAVQNLDRSYQILRDAVYDALAVQTRLTPYIEGVQLVIDDKGLRVDSSDLTDSLVAAHTADFSNKALPDLVELLRIGAPALQSAGYDALNLLREWVAALPADSPLRAQAHAAGLNQTTADWTGHRGTVLMGGSAGETLSGGPNTDAIDAGGGNDHLVGHGGSDLLAGGSGDDHLEGSHGNDTLDGGSGNDQLRGDVGSDTYLWGKGAGNDVITNSFELGEPGELDVIQIKAGTRPEDITITRASDDVYFTLSGTGETLRVVNAMQKDGASSYGIDAVVFDDLTTWGIEAIKRWLLTGTSANEHIMGYAATGDDLKGLGGDDRLDGREGDDTLDGGPGNDLLYGGWDWWGTHHGYGNDTYLFGRGDGQDRIGDEDATVGNTDVLRFKAGVAPADVQATRDADALVLRINGTSDEVRVLNYFRNDGVNINQVEEIRFADATSTVWRWADIRTKVLQADPTGSGSVLQGYAGADSIVGGEGQDQLFGAAGNDTLAGGAGDDFLRGEDGADQLKGEAGNDTLYGGTGDDTLDSGAGNDLLYGGWDWWGTHHGYGNDTYLFGRGDGQDRIGDEDATVGNTDVLRFKAGVAPADVQATRDADALVLRINGTSDEVRVLNYFVNLTTKVHLVEEIRFADAPTVAWQLSDVMAALPQSPQVALVGVPG